MKYIFNRIDHQTNKTPDQLLYAFLDTKGNITQQYTYTTFMQRVDVIASNLSRRKLQKNDRILLAYPPGLEMLCAFFACAKIGLIPVPVYPPTAHGFQSAIYKTTYIAKDCEAHTILTSREYYWSFKLNMTRNALSKFSFKKQHLSSLDWVITDDFRQLYEFKEDFTDILFLQYTSGSTNHPKGVKVTHKNILHNCEAVLDFSPIGVSWLPQYHDMGLIGYYLFIILKGGTTYGFSPMDFIQRPALWLETLTKYQATASSAPNFAYEYCLRPDKIPDTLYPNLDLSSLKMLMTAAEPVNTEVYRRFLQKFKTYGLKPDSFYSAFGLAEFTLAVSSHGRKTLDIDKNKLSVNQLKIIKNKNSDNKNSIKSVMSCGKALADTIVKIVDKDKHTEVEEGGIGEIWLNGKSKCAGYWNKPDLTQQMFEASMINSNIEHNNFLRTGDLGFIHKGELYVCGRVKDMIIIRGLNFYPQDIERIVEATSKEIRKGCVAAFSIEDEGEKLVVVAEVKSSKAIPDAVEITTAIRQFLNIETHEIIFIPPRSIPKTSSGKIARHQAKAAWLNGQLKPLYRFSIPEIAMQESDTNSPFAALKIQYGLQGNELSSLSEIGIGSLDLAVLLHDIKALLKENNAEKLAQKIDLRLLQEISVSELFDLAEQFKNASPLAAIALQKKINHLQQEHKTLEQQSILSDIHLNFNPITLITNQSIPPKTNNILLTGGTGFFGPFLLKSLLEQTDENIYILIRAKNNTHAKERLYEALKTTGYISDNLIHNFKKRVIPICGDLAKIQLGLDKKTWYFLTNHIKTIYHNGAIVNYLFNYDKMRDVNVSGTNEMLRFAYEGHPKIFNHISTTFIFGWAVKDILYESDTNQDLDLLDFGYSQTKWVSEQIVKDAIRQGFQGRIFRPALISPSVKGGGNNFDISIRLFAHMINYGMGIDALNQVSLLPADIAANNIIAIANLNDTLNKNFHVTRDQYANMSDITRIITELTGQSFEYYTIPDFVDELLKNCSKDDLLFPLLDFFTRSVDKISNMEFKRYDSSNYQTARDRSAHHLPDPSLHDTIKGMLLFMERKGIIRLPTLLNTSLAKLQKI